MYLQDQSWNAPSLTVVAQITGERLGDCSPFFPDDPLFLPSFLAIKMKKKKLHIVSYVQGLYSILFLFIYYIFPVELFYVLSNYFQRIINTAGGLREVV